MTWIRKTASYHCGTCNIVKIHVHVYVDLVEMMFDLVQMILACELCDVLFKQGYCMTS